MVPAPLTRPQRFTHHLQCLLALSTFRDPRRMRFVNQIRSRGFIRGILNFSERRLELNYFVNNLLAKMVQPRHSTRKPQSVSLFLHITRARVGQQFTSVCEAEWFPVICMTSFVICLTSFGSLRTFACTISRLKTLPRVQVITTADRTKSPKS